MNSSASGLNKAQLKAAWMMGECVSGVYANVYVYMCVCVCARVGVCMYVYCEG